MSLHITLEMEAAIGKAWAAMAHKEGHRGKVPPSPNAQGYGCCVVKPIKPEDRKKVVDALAAGMGRFRLHKALGLPDHMVRQILREETNAPRLGVRRDARAPLNEEEAARFAEMWNSGVPRAKIAETFGMTPHSVFNRAKRMRLAARGVGQ